MNRRFPPALAALVFLTLLGACSCNEKSPGGGGGDGDAGDPDGSMVGDGSTDGSTDSSVVTPCGNGTIDSGETCDDSNAMAGDGCSATCTVEPGWDCSFSQCLAAQCGDGLRAGSEACDDGNRTSGDGCSIRCTLETGWVCVTPGFPCREAVCGDSAVEADEQCDDGDMAPNDGCSATCQLEAGYYCPTPGSDCVTNVCGDGQVRGLEQCDDGGTGTGDGCDGSCRLETGYYCPTPGQACVPSTCGDGVVQGLEGCDDDDTDSMDGCSSTCTVEPFYACTGSPSVCTKPVEFVRIAVFPAPMAQPQAVHYDPATRSFVAYGFNQVQGWQEFCLDGTPVPNASRTRPRALIGNQLDGAAYDPFHDRFLFVRQNGQLTEIDRMGDVVRQVNLSGVGTAGGVQVGDDGRLYVANHFAEKIVVFDRFATTQVDEILTPTDGPYLDNLFVIPGQGWIGYYNLPPGGTVEQFGFHTYDGGLVGRSSIPGVLFVNGETFPARADGGEAAADGGYFLVCSEYLTNGGTDNGICQLFAQTCQTDLECAARVPGTVCKTSEPIPYCYAPAVARDDFYTVPRETMQTLSVLDNDSFAEAVCLGNAAMITAVSTGDRGGTIAIHSGGAAIDYTSAAGQCGFVETFTYTANLGGTATDMATVRVTVPCVCGNGTVEPGEQCDDNNTLPGDGCSPTCRTEAACGNGTVEPGEQCDDNNTLPGDGCSPNCTFEIVIE